MKKINLIIKLGTCLIFLFSTLSCSDFLDEEVYSFSSAENLFSTAANTELALTGVYDAINAGSIQGSSNHHMWGRGMHYLLMLGDEIAPKLTGAMNDPHHRTIATVSYNPEAEFVTYAWFGHYVGIDRANWVIENTPNVPDMDETRKIQVIGEARCLRGFYYLYLTWLFGDVPTPTKPNSDPYATRSPLKDVYKIIEEDLTYAYEVLPDRNPKAGRVNKWTAAGFLVKMYTYLAACKENNVGKELNSTLNNFDWVNSSECYRNANLIANEIYENSGYKMIVPYQYNFLEATKDQQKEECLMLAMTGVGGNSDYYLFSYLTGPQGGANTNGGNYGWLRSSGELYSKYFSTDPRLRWNITGSMSSTDFETINGVKYFKTVPLYSTGSNVCLGKFRQADPLTRTSQGIPNWAGIIDFPILRFSDIVLLYAETKFKSENDEAAARNLLQEVRRRACTGINGEIDEIALQKMDSAYYKSDFMEELMDERSRELCGESWRRIDLIRMGKMTETIANLKTTIENQYYFYNTELSTIKSNYQPYKIWFPIPKREIEANQNLTQNPGYLN
ncbi:MAG TPA: RagB/SusD family nutrient uptake outer membrane protein [Paludibacteraceae bacterium]|nr:RagB/SusD family nutrient uptake outer membrane protein [Paludibacteraceae bacterium]